MGLEYVDIFYSHRPTADAPLEETMGALAHAVRQGKALYVGMSCYSARCLPHFSERGRTLAHSSAFLLHAEPLGRARAAGDAR
jgi:aryl-alcohol dehydrogenase-like predicted oxidoreductase